MWSCPTCAYPLELDSRQWHCINRHSFDVAKEGYVNLLLANQKHSADPGDNRLMINARRAFLQQDYYLPLALHIAELLTKSVDATNAKSEKLRLHDAGCGEGYYLDRVIGSLAHHSIAVAGTGSDISKAAIAKASKKYSTPSFAVASSFNLPLADASLSALQQVFAPVDDGEVFRVLEPNGVWLQVTPGPSHLTELKHSLYDTAMLHKPQAAVPQGFVQLQQDSLMFELALDDTISRENLLMMTPFYWAAKANERPKIIQDMGRVTADFVLRVLQKHG